MNANIDTPTGKQIFLKVIKLHDEKSPLLLGHLKEGDNLIETNVISYIEPKQTTLFDF